MKKAMLFSAALLTCAGLFAQFGPPRLVSPELRRADKHRPASGRKPAGNQGNPYTPQI